MQKLCKIMLIFGDYAEMMQNSYFFVFNKQGLYLIVTSKAENWYPIKIGHKLKLQNISALKLVLANLPTLLKKQTNR